MRIFDLDGECDASCVAVTDPSADCIIGVYLPGPPGPGGVIVDVGSRTAPAAIVGAIIAPINDRQRSFIVGSGGPVLNPTLPNGADTQEWWLFGTSDVDTVTLNNAANLQLSGQWIGGNGSMLYLQWDGTSKYVEAGRNEI